MENKIARHKKKRGGTKLLSSGGMIVREIEPLNLEMPFGSLDAFLTPVERFFVRSHFLVPRIDLNTWRLKVEGEVKNPLELTCNDLKGMPSVTIPVTFECAGNGRAFLTPQAKGAQWERGAVSTAEWTGVPMGEILRRAGVKKSALEVILEGADEGEIKEPPGPAGTIHYARSVPLRKAEEDVLLAFKMNGEDLSPAHGAPLRGIVPGWYGMASVKWLTRITVIAEPFNGYYQTVDYAYWERSPNGPVLVPITEMQVKAQIARPGIGDSVRAGKIYHVWGAAWTTEAEITMVEVSINCGSSWHKARLRGEPVRNAWRLWDFDWQVPANPGKATLIARATDSKNRTQPVKRDENRSSYLINHLLPIEVEVR